MRKKTEKNESRPKNESCNEQIERNRIKKIGESKYNRNNQNKENMSVINCVWIAKIASEIIVWK